jgi:hypothetical protein
MLPLDVAVIGSYVQDHAWLTETFPSDGETRLATGFNTGPGGKGFNQAVACHRQGVKTCFIGAIGNDALGENAWFVDLQHTTAFLDNSLCRCGICRQVVAEIVCSTENAIVGARDRVHERRVITDNCRGETLDFRYDCDLPAMRLEIGVMHKLARADTRAIDHEVESFVDIFQFFKADVRVDFAASLVKARGEVIEINRGVRERNAH